MINVLTKNNEVLGFPDTTGSDEIKKAIDSDQYGTISEDKPSFYQKNIQPALEATGMDIFQPKFITDIAPTPERAFVTSFARGATADIVKPAFSQQEADAYPAQAFAGQLAGTLAGFKGLGSLLNAIKLPELSAYATKVLTSRLGQGRVAEIAASAIPSAIQSGVAGGVYGGVSKTANEIRDEEHPELAKIGEAVLHDTLWWGGIGAVGAVVGPASKLVGIAASSGLGYVMAKADGANEQDALLNGAVLGGFHLLSTHGEDPKVRQFVVYKLQENITDNIAKSHPLIADPIVQQTGREFMDHIADQVIDKNLIENNGVSLASNKTSMEQVLESPELTNKMVEKLSEFVLPKDESSTQPQDKTLTPEANKTPEAIKQFAETNKENILKSYAEKHGNLVSNDLMKKEFSPVGYTGEDSRPYQAEAGKITKEYLNKVIDENKNSGKELIITTGGTGAGKSSAISNFSKSGNIVLDVNLTKPDLSSETIQHAIDNGLKPTVVFVLRDPKKSFIEGVLKRSVDQKSPDYKRIISVDEHIKIHEQARKTFDELRAKFGDKVSFKVLDNQGKPQDAKQLSLENFDKISYTYSEAKKELLNYVKSNESIPSATKDLYLRSIGDVGKDASKPSGQQASERRALEQGNANTGSADKPTAEVKPTPQEDQKVVKGKAKVTKVSSDQLPVGTGEVKSSGLEARVKSALESIPDRQKSQISDYKEMNKAEQLKAASQYVSENPEDAIAVLKGDKSAPEGLLHNSIALALEEHAANSNDANLVLKLASLRSTRAGQEISILTERDVNSPIRYIDELQQRKIEALGDKESALKIKEKEIKKVKEAIKKPARGDWTAFIESIKC